MKRLLLSIVSLPALFVAMWAITAWAAPSNSFVLSQLAVAFNQTVAEVTCGVLPAQFGYAPGDVRRFGAKGDGTTDDTGAIQNTINCNTVSGGTTTLGNGSYKITSTLTCGNGSSSAASTIYGCIVQGTAQNSFQTPGYPNSYGTRILWAGATSTPVLQMTGPLLGWGLRSLYIDCNSVAGSTGLQVISASYGNSWDLRFQNCVTGIKSTVVASLPAGISNINSQHNTYTDITIRMPAITGSIGITMTGTSSFNTCYGEWNGVYIVFPGSPPGNEYGIYFAASDNERIKGLHFANSAASNTTVVAYDYSINNSWPADDIIDYGDFGPNNAPMVNVGSPSVAANAPQNGIFHPSMTNGVHVNPALQNLYFDDSRQPVTIANLPTCSSTVNVGHRLPISNGVASPTYFATPSTTGTTLDWTLCTGTGWVYD